MRLSSRVVHGGVAVLAWAGVALVVLLSAIGAYADGGATPKPGHVYGTHPAGAAGALSRVADTLSYFTEWSSVVVGAAFTMLAVGDGPDRRWRRVLLLDALLMITVTAIVYAVLLAPAEHVTGWSRLTNPWQHIAVPAAALLAWLVVGPRRWFRVRDVPAALLVPLAWVGYMLARGAVIGAYPYAFVDVVTHGYAAVTLTIAAILAFALVVAGMFALLDGALGRRGTARRGDKLH